MIDLVYEMTYEETIAGPLGSTKGSPLGERLCWTVETARLQGPRIEAALAMPGVDLMRMGSDGMRRPDLRAQLMTDDGELILLGYDVALIRPSERFLTALMAGEATEFGDQYMRIAPRFEVAAGRYAWLGESLFLGRGRLSGPKSITYEIYRSRGVNVNVASQTAGGLDATQPRRRTTPRRPLSANRTLGRSATPPPR